MRLSGTIVSVAVISVILLAASQRATAEINTVYIVVPSHLDIGFTAPPDTVARGYKDCIDHAIQLCEKYPDYFYTIECAWQLREWMKRSSPEEIRNLSVLVRSGRIEIGGAFATMHSGMMSGESVNRMFDLGLSLAKQLGGEIRTAIQDDVPGYTWAYPQAMRQRGINYFLTGINTSFGGKPKLDDKDVPFYWEGPDGSRVLTWIAFGSYADGSDWGVGIWEKELAVLLKVPGQVWRLERADYPYDAFLIMASPGDNVDAAATEKIHRIIGRWNAIGKSPVLKLATPRQFFEYMERKYGDRFPVYRGDWSGHWAPAKLGAPRLIARMRHAQRILPAAEALWSVLALSGAARFPSEDIASAWDDLLTISEHSAAAGTGWPNLTTKEQVIWENWQHAARGLSASYSSSMLVDEGMEVLANSITAADPFIVVFNSFPSRRIGYVEVNVPPDLPERGLVIKPAEGEQPVQWDLLEDRRTIRFLADEIPGLGYRLFRVSRGPAQEVPSAREAQELDNRFLTVTTDEKTGYIKSIYDKKLRLEWVQKGRLFGALHLVPHLEAMMGGTSHPAEARASRVELIEGKTYKSLRVVRDKGALVETRVTVVHGSRMMKLENVLDTSKIPGEDSVVALLEFPFNLDAESLKIALDGPNHYRWWPDDYLPGTARTGQVVQSYTLLHDEKACASFIPVEAPILSLGKIGLHSLDKPGKARIYSYLFDREVWGENKDTGRTRYEEVEPALGTRIRFTYYLDLSGYSGSDEPDARLSGGFARQPALEATVPLFARYHSPWGKQEGKLGDDARQGFLNAENPNFELSSATLVSREGRTYWQVRLLENFGLTRETVTARVEAHNVRSAWLLDTPTDRRTPLPVHDDSFEIPISAFKTTTFLIQPDESRAP